MLSDRFSEKQSKVQQRTFFFTNFLERSSFVRTKLPTLILAPIFALSLASCSTVTEPTAETKPKASTEAPTKPTPPAFGTKESTSEAVKHATDYVRAAHSNGYFLSGDWAKDGGKPADAKKFLKKYYSADIVKSVDQWENKSKKDGKYAEFMTALFIYWDDSDTYAPYEKCKSEKPKACTLSLKQSKVTSKVDKSKKIVNVKVTQDSEFPLWSKEINQTVKAIGTFKYDLDLAPKAGGGWEIVEYDADMYFDRLTPVNL